MNRASLAHHGRRHHGRPGRRAADRVQHRDLERRHGQRADRHDHLGRGRRVPGHDRARLRRDHHRGGAEAGRDPRLDRPGPRAGPRRGRRSAPPRSPGAATRTARPTGSTRHSRRSAPRRRCATTTPTARPIEEIAKLEPGPDPGDELRHHRGGVRQAHQDRPGRRLPRVPRGPPRGRTRSTMVGEALGRTDLADEVEAETQAAIDAAEEDHPEVDGQSLIYGYLTTADMSTVGHLHARRTRASRSCATSAWSTRAVVDAIKRGRVLRHGLRGACRRPGVRRAAHLRRRPTSDMQTFSDDELLGQIPAIATGTSYAETDKHVAPRPSTNPTPLSIPFVIEHFLPQVAEAVDGLVTLPDDRPRARRPAREPRRPTPTGTPTVARPRSWRWRGRRAALSVLVGARSIPPARHLGRGRPGAHAIATARLARTCSGSRSAPRSAWPAPACRASPATRWPTRASSASTPAPSFAMVAGDLGLRRLRACRRTSGSPSPAPRWPWCWCTRSRRSAATAPRRSSWRSPAPR